MYTPKHNATTDLAIIRALVKSHGFGTLVVPRADGQIEIAHLPFLLDAADEGDHLRVHLARANRVWRDVLAADRPGDVIVIFRGPHGYVSPTWYEKSREDVPTWNYAVVHAHVTTPHQMTEAELLRQLDDLARENEAASAIAEPWCLDEHPADSRDEMVKHIVGLSLPVARWQAKLKLSQNRTPADHARVVAAFEERGTDDDRAMASMMRR